MYTYYYYSNSKIDIYCLIKYMVISFSYLIFLIKRTYANYYYILVNDK